MGNIRGGDIQQVLINGRSFDPANEGTMNYRLSGFIPTNLPTGNGKQHTNMRRKLGGFDGLALSIDSERLDVEFLQEIWNSGATVPVQITKSDGVVYDGSLSGEGELNPNSGDGTLEIAMMGEKFEQT
jgi:hypothetical protein